MTFGVKPVDLNPSAIATGIVGAFASPGSLFTRISSAVTMTGCRVSVGQDGGEDLIGFSPFNVACTGAAATVTPNVAALIHKRTARGGRRGRGRMFLPWAIVETQVDNAGVLDPAQNTSLQTAATAFFDALAAGGEPMYLLHGPGVEKEGEPPPPPPPPPTIVVSLDVDRIVSTQRRRLGR